MTDATPKIKIVRSNTPHVCFATNLARVRYPAQKPRRRSGSLGRYFPNTRRVAYDRECSPLDAHEEVRLTHVVV